MDIQQIKQQANIVTHIGRYVQLHKKGTLYLGLCPFHDDHHPSLTVNPVKQHYRCYACGARGDVIEFIKEIEKCSFGEAIQKLSPQPPPPPKRGTVKNTATPETVAPMKEQAIPFPTIPHPMPPSGG